MRLLVVIRCGENVLRLRDGNKHAHPSAQDEKELRHRGSQSNFNIFAGVGEETQG
jgi:hypothetical protein